MDLNNKPVDTSVNINIRISKNLKELSSALLMNMGTNQSQFIRDSLQYVVNHNTLPWQENNSNTLLNKYTIIQQNTFQSLQSLCAGNLVDPQAINSICASLDDIHLQSSRKLDELHAHGMSSIPHSSLNSMLLQLTSLLRYNSSYTAQNYSSYSPVVANQIRQLLENIDLTIRSNNL
ncbi:MAG: hypothetical protein GQ547_00420 [Methylophaga sp.]|nr:hypothetical protein [Methylophaga sp.]